MNPLRYVYAVLALLILGAGAAGVITYRHMAQQAAELAPLKAQLADLQNSYATLAQAVAQRDATTAVIRKDRATTTKRLDDATKADPDASRYLSERIPDSVRRVYTDPPQR